jgi:hypothetical protein
MLRKFNLLQFDFWIWLQSFERKVKNKNILRKQEQSTIKNGTLL